jgi:hypothetical protein
MEGRCQVKLTRRKGKVLIGSRIDKSEDELIDGYVYEPGPLDVYRSLNSEGKPGKRWWSVGHNPTGYAVKRNIKRLSDAEAIVRGLTEHGDPERIATDDPDAAGAALVEAGAKWAASMAEPPDPKSDVGALVNRCLREFMKRTINVGD